MLNNILIIVSILVLAVVVMFFFRGKASQKGVAVGLVDGKLSKCSKKPNCVCSEFPNDKSHFVEPIDVSQVNMGLHFHKVSKAIVANGGIIVEETDDYIAAKFTSGLFKFVDDVEVRLDKEAKVIHLRSASREGYSDLGVNAKRIEAIKSSYNN